MSSSPPEELVIPSVKLIDCPSKVYPLPLSMMERNAVRFIKLLKLVNCIAPDGNVRSFPETGAVPPQLLPVVHRSSSPPPVHVLVRPKPRAGTSGDTNARANTAPRHQRQPFRAILRTLLALSFGVSRATKLAQKPQAFPRAGPTGPTGRPTCWRRYGDDGPTGRRCARCRNGNPSDRAC